MFLWQPTVSVSAEMLPLYTVVFRFSKSYADNMDVIQLNETWIRDHIGIQVKTPFVLKNV